MVTNHGGFEISRCGFFVSAEHPFLGASLDALIQCDCCGQGVVEIKCPQCANQMSFVEAADRVGTFCLSELSEGKLKLKCDHSYYYQCQLQMFVTKRNFCDFVVWSPNISEKFVPGGTNFRGVQIKRITHPATYTANFVRPGCTEFVHNPLQTRGYFAGQ